MQVGWKMVGDTFCGDIVGDGDNGWILEQMLRTLSESDESSQAQKEWR